MQKYKLSAKALEKAFEKLISVGIVRQEDLDFRRLNVDRTVDIREDIRLTQTLGTIWAEIIQSQDQSERRSPHSETTPAVVPDKASAKGAQPELISTPKRDAEEPEKTKLGVLSEPEDLPQPPSPSKMRPILSYIMPLVVILIMLSIGAIVILGWIRW